MISENAEIGRAQFILSLSKLSKLSTKLDGRVSKRRADNIWSLSACLSAILEIEYRFSPAWFRKEQAGERSITTRSSRAAVSAVPSIAQGHNDHQHILTNFSCSP